LPEGVDHYWQYAIADDGCDGNNLQVDEGVSDEDEGEVAEEELQQHFDDAVGC
jgi:hypothetical protein